MIKYLPRVRLYTDREKDSEILAWLSKMPKGLKSKTIKDAIWASYKGISPTPPPQGPPIAAKTPQEKLMRTPNGTMHGSFTFDTRELLADIRQIVEAGVAQGLAHHGRARAAKEEPSSVNEIEDLLDDLNMSFMLEDDEEEES